MSDGTTEARQALLDGLLSGGVSSILERLEIPAVPVLRPAPDQVSGFRVRLDLHGTQPAVWRRLELPGDLTLPRVHDLIQTAMGWTDSHLHRFRTGPDPRSSYFVTTFDLEDDEEGLLEDDVRLDQLLATAGDTLWYDYDFGDGWDHVLRVEAVLDEPPAVVRCTGGAMACPPEDCGGIGGYEQLAGWVNSGYDDAHLPEGFEDASHGRGWLPRDWHPDVFDLEAVDAALSVALVEPVDLSEELTALSDQLERRGIRLLREILRRSQAQGPMDVTEDEAARLTEPYRILLEVLGDGVTLTGAGYLPPSVVEQYAERSGITGWWIGKANREDLTPPVASVRTAARALGLVSVRKGRLTPTAAGIRCRTDPLALWGHVVGRLPLGTKDFDRQAGWMALAVAGSGVAAEDWAVEVVDLLRALGWRAGRDRYVSPSPTSPTLRVLEQLAGSVRQGWRVTGTDPAVAASARAVVHRG